MVNKKKARPGIIDLQTGRPLDEVEAETEETVEETPVLNQTLEAPAEPQETVLPIESIPAPSEDVAPVEERLKARIAKSEAGTPTLLQFEQRSGRPCSVLVELDVRTVREAWQEWCAENGRTNQEGFVMALHDAMDSFPVRIMRPCVAYDLK